jgi:superfamily II DNA helicase RecQ
MPLIYSALQEDETDNFLICSAPMHEVMEGKFSLIYAHPETLVDNANIWKMLRSKVYKDRVCAIVVDEVHMISEWYDIS